MVVLLYDIHLPTWYFPSLSLAGWVEFYKHAYHIHKCSVAFCCGSRNTWGLLVNIQETLSHSVWKISFATERIAVFSFNWSLFRQQASRCRICTSLPGEKFMWLSTHIPMAPECIRFSDSNWASTFRSVWKHCCIPVRELEHHSFQAASSGNSCKILCWIKNIYHLGEKMK